MSFSSGWFKARARPWNEAVSDPMLRLERGGAEFVAAVTDRLHEEGAADVYSPALYPGPTRPWRRAGFTPYAELEVMERGVTGSEPQPRDGPPVRTGADIEHLLTIDRLSFDGFWGMNRLGLEEALGTSTSAVALTVAEEGRRGGYAIVGSQWGVAYLHRIAVVPEDSGRGLGSLLLGAAITWARAAGATTMVLNVRKENARAIGIYERSGFTRTGTRLQVLRHPSG